MSKLDIALAFHRLGFNVIPTGDDKRAVGAWKSWQEERLTEETLEALPWERDDVRGLAAISGAVSSCLVALDLDKAPSRHAVDALLARLGLPQDYPWTVRTPGKGGGWHVWVRSPGLAEALGRAGLKRKAKYEGPWSGADHLELRWADCYTLLPPSAHPDGRYQWAHANSIPPVPPSSVAGHTLLRLTTWDAADAKDAATISGIPADADYSAYISAALDSEADTLSRAPMHHRNDTLNAAAFAMGTLVHAGANRDEVAGRLVPIARQIGLTEREIAATFASGWSDGEANPRHMPEPRKRVEPKPEAQPEAQDEQADEPEPKPTTSNLLDIIRRAARYKDHPMEPGIDYPWRGVNGLTRGLRKGWLCYLAGYPGSGKTAAALEIVFSAAKQRRRVLLNSLEMNEEEIALRLIQRWGLDTGRLFAGQINEDDVMAFDNAANFPAYANVEMAGHYRLTELAAEVERSRPDLVVVDYLGLMDLGRDNLYEGTTKLSRGLKALARDCNVPVICLSQLTRPQDRSRATAPSMHDLRNSGQLEGDADQIIFVFREQDNDSKTVKSEGRFIVAKARFGRPGKSDFIFDGDRQVFELPPSERVTEQGWSVYQGGRS